jgi:hypothetical protein
MKLIKCDECNKVVDSGERTYAITIKVYQDLALPRRFDLCALCFLRLSQEFEAFEIIPVNMAEFENENS